jgi:DNA modification methylase
VTVRILAGDCVEQMRTLPDCSVDAVVTDPPYGINFMGKAWDGKAIEEAVSQPRDLKGATRLTGSPDNETRTLIERSGSAFANRAGEAGAYDFSPKGMRAFQAWTSDWAREAFRVLKPGGHLLSFSSPRTYHRMTCGIEEAGFEIRDCIAWNYGSGFPKSLNVSADDRFCQCGKESDGDSDLSRVRQGVQAPAQPSGAREATDLLEPLQGSGAREGMGSARAQGPSSMDGSERGELPREDERRAQPRVEGRGHVLAEGGELPADQVRALPGVGAADGEEGWLRDGAPAADGGADRTTVDTDGGGASPEPRSARQQDRELGALAGQPEPQARRAWPDCPRCGKPGVPPGLGTALKPAFEPVVVARKPLAGTVAANVLAHGTGALNVDGCRIATDDRWEASGKQSAPSVALAGGADGSLNVSVSETHELGRWPANVILDEEAAALLDEQSGELAPGASPPKRGLGSSRVYGDAERAGVAKEREQLDGGGASRFFYCAKVSRAERNAGIDTDRNVHPTVKPIALMRWLCRLVTPPGGTVLDPFLGSGSTGCAAALEGFDFIGCEREPDYVPIAEARIRFWEEHGEDGLQIVKAEEAAEAVRADIRASGQVDIFELLAEEDVA